MEYIILLYVFFTGCVYTSWAWNLKDSIWIKFFVLFIGFTLGWFITPILIGRVLKQIYKD